MNTAAHGGFLPFPASPALLPQDVHVVRLALDLQAKTVAWLAGILDHEERRRAARFAFERDRRRFTVAHGLLRIILGCHVGASPASLVFATQPFGKPLLREYGQDVRFNLSHSGGHALLVVALRRDVGIDIEECRRDVPFAEVAGHAFSVAEQRALVALPPAEIPVAFFRGWTRKESFVKARGDGLSAPLDRFDVSLAPNPLQVLLGSRIASDDLARWVITSLEVGTGHAAAVTVEGRDARIATFEAPPIV